MFIFNCKYNKSIKYLLVPIILIIFFFCIGLSFPNNVYAEEDTGGGESFSEDSENNDGDIDDGSNTGNEN